MVTYKEYGPNSLVVRVNLDRRQAGTIEKEEAGWRYYPKGQLTGGDWFATVEEVQKSLEES